MYKGFKNIGDSMDFRTIKTPGLSPPKDKIVKDGLLIRVVERNYY